MSSRSNAFTGIPLTEQHPKGGAGLDQRLFSHATPDNRRENSGTPEVRDQRTKEVGKEVSQPHKFTIPLRFDLGQKAYRKDSFLFTNAEFEALEDLKLDLRRTFDIKSTKNDLARCALQHLIEDYRSHGAASVAVRRLRERKT